MSDMQPGKWKDAGTAPNAAMFTSLSSPMDIGTRNPEYQLIPGQITKSLAVRPNVAPGDLK